MTAAAGRGWVAGLLAAAMLLAGCDIHTAGAPGGSVTLHAVFDDVADLTPGHKVQASNVVVGSVRSIRLDGYQARVSMSIVDSFRAPEGVAAVVRRTSLLGEYYVDLVLPEGFDPVAGPFLPDGGVIADASTQLDVEQLAEQAAAVVGAITADDIGATVDALAHGLRGRGPVLNRLVDDAATVAAALADQQGAIASTVDSLGSLGATLAPASGELARLLDDLAAATSTVAGSRERAVAAVEALVDLARATSDTVLEPHAERIVTLLRQLEPLLGTLAERSDTLARLILDTSRFTEALPTAIHEGTILLLTWAYLDGVPVVPLTTLSGADPLDALRQLVGGQG